VQQSTTDNHFSSFVSFSHLNANFCDYFEPRISSEWTVTFDRSLPLRAIQSAKQRFASAAAAAAAAAHTRVSLLQFYLLQP
jgi:hypothetical protein